MTKQDMMSYVDQICEQEGYLDSPAYDLIFSQCCIGRNDKDAKDMIKDLLISYNM